VGGVWLLVSLATFWVRVTYAGFGREDYGKAFDRLMDQETRFFVKMGAS
jgi:hypothetical protein